MTTTTEPTTSTRTPFWRDLRVIRVLLQIGTIAVVAAVLYYLYNNLVTNLRAQGIRSDFGFLDQPFGVPIADAPLSPNAAIRRALWAGIRNTFSLVLVGLPVLTVLGVVVGVARLSTNWLTRKVATLYVELFRNLPPLLIIVFVYRVVVLPLPRPAQSAEPLDLFVINNLRITIPSFMSSSGYTTYLWILLGAAIAAIAVAWWRTRRFVATGTPHHRVAWGFGTFLFFGALFYLVLGGPILLSIPDLDGRVITGGFSGLGSWFAVMLALVFYTASHVAEIVRGSIQAVPKGQTEAADALALTGFQRLRFVVLPQALRIAIPPTINQYLNYTKNTSLAIAVAFSEVTLVAFQAIGNGAPAPQVVLMLMGCYLLFSLTISLVVNLLNRRLQLVTN